jgi:hypothetical protein
MGLANIGGLWGGEAAPCALLGYYRVGGVWCSSPLQPRPLMALSPFRCLVLRPESLYILLSCMGLLFVFDLKPVASGTTGGLWQSSCAGFAS